MNKNSRLAHRFPAVFAVVILGMIITVSLCVITAHSMAEQDHELLLHTSAVYSARIEQLLDRLFHKTDVLSAIILENDGDLKEETFQKLASTLDDGAGIRAVQCLPDGTVRYCYPLEGNEAVMGDNIFEDPERRPDAMLAVDTKSIALSGPYELNQGGLGLVARNPVFLVDEAGDEAFWGFTVIILDLPDALEPILLGELTQSGYAYRLHCVTDAGEEKTIAEAGTLPGDGVIDYEIHVPNHVWTLSMAPESGWIHWNAIWIILLVGAVISALFAIAIYQWRERTWALQKASWTDELTGLYNRRYLSEMVDKACRDQECKFALLYLDLDRFKQINDALGHQWGDTLLVEVTKRIAGAIGAESILARIGGDEFVVVAECGGDGQECADMLNHVHAIFEEPFLLDGKSVTAGVSIGCARFPQDGTDFNTLMYTADQRMYEEKQVRRKSQG